MQESFLHFVWQFQYFDKTQLHTTVAQPLQIVRTGLINPNTGPDFSQARVVLDAVEWAGHVEIHLKTSDWNGHRHNQDAAYDNVILHVVWQHDQEVFRQDGTPIPTLELKDRVDKGLLHTYEQLLSNQAVIPCASQFAAVSPVRKRQALDKALWQRLQTKAAFVKELLADNTNDWENTAYQLVATHLGFKVNNAPFLRLAKAVPLRMLQKHRNSLRQLEALLFGQAGFLEDENLDAYGQQLRQEYQFLSHKYTLSAGKLYPGEWKFARLRPANFPTLRIAQLAALLHKHPHFFSALIHFDEPLQAFHFWQVPLSEYWQTHYLFGKEAAAPVNIGKSSAENLSINTIVPLLTCYAQEKDDHALIEKAIALLESLPAEDNQITRMWKELGLPIKNAFDTQASLELYNEFCVQKKCLACPIGVSLLKPA